MANAPDDFVIEESSQGIQPKYDIYKCKELNVIPHNIVNSSYDSN